MIRSICLATGNHNLFTQLITKSDDHIRIFFFYFKTNLKNKSTFFRSNDSAVKEILILKGKRQNAMECSMAHCIKSPGKRAACRGGKWKWFSVEFAMEFLFSVEEKKSSENLNVQMDIVQKIYENTTLKAKLPHW